MKALFAGTCFICGLGFGKGAEINYDRESKKASHAYCFAGDTDAEALADRLGYRTYTWEELIDGCRPKA